MYCFICPTYGHYGYARSALESFFNCTPSGVAVVVDDGHADFHKFWEDRWKVTAHHFLDRQGLTRSWNFGLRLARDLGAEYTICGNSDVLFTPGWEVGPTALLENKSVGLVGPLSNGPGWSNAQQNIWDHIPGYQPSDAPEQLAGVAASLSSRYQATDHLEVEEVNGFFLVGRTSRWWEGRFDPEHVFNPAPCFALTENEQELQRRFHALGWRSLVSLRTYIFHYRSVTRGDRFKQGMWYRR